MCLPTTKTWEWHMGAAVADFSKLEAFYADATNRGTLWTPNALDGTPEDIAVPYLLSIPAVIVNLLREQGQAQTPHEVLQIIDEFLSTDPSADTLDWALLRRWCLLASQTGTQQNKSRLNLDTTPVTIDDEEFDLWMGNRLDVSLGPRPMVAAAASQPANTVTNTAAEYLALSKMLASQNMAAQVGTVEPMGGQHSVGNWQRLQPRPDCQTKRCMWGARGRSHPHHLGGYPSEQREEL